MSGFLKTILGAGKKEITAAASPLPPQIGEVVCGDNLSLVIRAHDSSYNLNRVPTFARQYELYLKGQSERDAEKFADNNRKTVAPDGTVKLDYLFGNQWAREHLPPVKNLLQRNNIALDDAAVYAIIEKDIAEHPKPTETSITSGASHAL